jgi:hypothetical protein
MLTVFSPDEMHTNFRTHGRILQIYLQSTDAPLTVLFIIDLNFRLFGLIFSIAKNCIG